jgi:general secretion pathway protein I
MKRQQGFTIVEVVIALAILGMGLTVIMELFSGGLRLGKTSGEYIKAVNYGRLKLEEIALKPTLKEEVEEGKFDDLFRWQVVTKKVNLLPEGQAIDPKPPVELFHMDIQIIWKSGLKEKSIRVESYQTVKPEEKS